MTENPEINDTELSREMFSAMKSVIQTAIESSGHKPGSDAWYGKIASVLQPVQEQFRSANIPVDIIDENLELALLAQATIHGMPETMKQRLSILLHDTSMTHKSLDASGHRLDQEQISWMLMRHV